MLKFWPQSFSTHLLTAFVLRTLLILYSEYHDKISSVPYTDVDYKVFTDAARYISNFSSPYLRHTYRYTPLLAFLLTPNLFLHQTFGKFLFALIDLVVAILIKKIVGDKTKYGVLGACFWLYNPLAIGISTRGNADGISVLFVLLAVYFLGREKMLVCGLFHGLAIHFRLYPLVFSLPMYLHIGKNIIPNKKQVQLVLGCTGTLLALTSLFYFWYGYEFLYETYLYHLVRKDTRHNFSVYFYMLYLSAELQVNIWEKLLTFLPQLALLLVLSFSYHKSLNFCLFCQAFVMVAYNPVVTSQYFVWYLSLLPLSLGKLDLKWLEYVKLGGLWGFGQIGWLVPAYLLEFKNLNVFLYIWVQSLVFFGINLYILGCFIKKYKKE